MNNDYAKQGFFNGQILRAEHLIKMEEELLDTQGAVREIMNKLATGGNIVSITIREETIT